MIDTANNRVHAAVLRARAQLDTLDDDKRAAVDANLSIDWQEHFDYQQEQARAHASGILTTAEAQIAYLALGEVQSDGNGGWTEGTDTATKYVVTKLISELLSRRLPR